MRPHRGFCADHIALGHRFGNLLVFGNGPLAGGHTQRQIAHPVELHLVVVDQLPGIFHPRQPGQRAVEQLVELVEAPAVIGG
ncbi:hypothetical protein D3C86_1981160 [compost metagenome]